MQATHAGKIKRFGKRTWEVTKATGHAANSRANPLSDAYAQRKAKFAADATGTAVGEAVKQVLESQHPPSQVSQRRQTAQPGHDDTATAGDLSKFNAAFAEALRRGQPRGHGDEGMELLQVLTTPEFIDAIERGERTVQVNHAGGAISQEKVSLRTPVEEADPKFAAEMATRRQKIAAALRQDQRIENVGMPELEIIYFACVGRDTVPDTRIPVWEDHPSPALPNPRDAFFHFLEMAVEDSTVTEPGRYLGTVFKELASKCTLDADVDETRRRLYGIDTSLLNPNIARDYLTRRVALDRFIRSFSRAAEEVMSGDANQLHTPYRVLGLGIDPATAGPTVRRLSDGIRRDLLRATDQKSFDAILERLEVVQSSALPQRASDLMASIKSELEIRKSLLGPAPDANERAAQKQGNMAAIAKLLDDLDAVSITGAAKTELDTLTARLRVLHATESANAQDKAVEAIDQFEQKTRYPFKAIAEKMLGTLKKNEQRMARGELPLYERIIALNTYEGTCNEVKPVSSSKAWLRMLRFIKWGTENAWHSVFMWPLGLYKDKVGKPIWQRLKHFQGAVREGRLFGNYGKLAAEYRLTRKERLAFLEEYDKAKDQTERVACATRFVARYAGNDTKGELAGKWARAVAAIGHRNWLSTQFGRWNSYRTLRGEAMEADKELMETREEWLSHRRQGLSGAGWGLVAASTTVWLGFAGYDHARGRDELIMRPRLYNPVHGELFTTNWRGQVLNPGNWFSYDFGDADKAPQPSVMIQDLPQDLANRSDDLPHMSRSPMERHRFGAPELGTLLGIGTTMPAEERARSVEWLQEKNLEPSPWQAGKQVPSMLTYLDELRRGRRISAIELDKSSIGIPVMKVTREEVKEELSAGTIILDPAHTDEFVRAVMHAAGSGTHVTLAWLRERESQWVEKGYCQRRMDAQYAQLGVYSRDNSDFLIVNPVLSGQVGAWASLGSDQMHIAPSKPGDTCTTADNIVRFATERAKLAMNAGDLSKVSVETGDNAVALLKGFNVDGHLAAAIKQNDANPDPARVDFFISTHSYLNGNRTPADLMTLWKAIGSEERSRLLSGAVYAQIAREGEANGWFEERPKEFAAHQKAATHERAMKTFGLNAEDAAFVTKEGNEDAYALLDKLNQPRTDFVLRTEKLPEFVRELRLYKQQNPTGLASDFDPTLEKPGPKSAWAIKMGYIVDWGTRQAEQSAKASFEEKEARLQEIEKEKAEKAAKVEALKKINVSLNAKMKEKQHTLEVLDKKSGEWEQKALLESQINDLDVEIKKNVKEMGTLEGQPVSSEATAAAKPKYTVNDPAKAAFWKANADTQASVASVVGRVGKEPAIQAAMKAHNIPSLDQYLLDRVYEAATGSDAKRRKPFGMSVETDAQSGVVIKFGKADGLKNMLVGELRQLMEQK